LSITTTSEATGSSVRARCDTRAEVIKAVEDFPAGEFGPVPTGE
jgi:hypothetical protein